MKAGQTDLEVGTKVKIVNVKGEDSILNGLIGSVTHPFAFGCTDKGWIGLRFDEKVPLYNDDKINMHISNVELLPL